MRTIFALCLALLCTQSVPAAAAQRFAPSDLSRIVSETDPQISPDGKSIAIVVVRESLADDRSHSDIVVVDVESGRSTTQLQDAPGLANVRWSPHGQNVAFIANDKHDGSGHPQIFVMGATSGSPVQVTHSSTGVQQFTYSPDGKRFAFVANDPPRPRAKFDKSFEVGDNDYLTTEAPTAAHAWIVDTDGTHQRRLTSGSWSLPKVLPPSPPASPLQFSPDGRYLAITHRADPHSGDGRFSYVDILDVSSGRIRKLTTHTTMEGDASFSPDGKLVLYSYPRLGKTYIGRAAYVTSVRGGNGRDVSYGLNRNIVHAMWVNDSAVLVAGHDGPDAAVWLQPLNAKAQRLQLGAIEPREFFSLDGSVNSKGAFAFIGSTPMHPNELYYMSSLRAKPRQLTHYNDFIGAMQLGRNREIRWTGPNGFSEDGILTVPPGFDARKRYPVVLYIHGGPVFSSTLAFGAFPQAIAARGYVVFEPNYRGSDNRGNAYQRAISPDRGVGPGRDVMAGLSTVERLPYVNARKICVTGWSYGGYMTSWLIGHYQGWSCAIAGAAVNNWFDMYNLSDGNSAIANGFYPSPYLGSNFAQYWDNSPISGFSHIQTPTLILSDTGDYRVPIANSYEMYHALRDRGVPVRFFAYAVRGHFPSDPYNVEDVFNRWLWWLNQYLH